MEYVLTFLEGIASFISPCLLPMLPIYISYFAGENDKKTSKALINSIGFVLGFSIIFLLLAILVNRVGILLGNIVANIKIIFGILIILFGLNYMNILKLNFLNKSKIIKSNPENLNFFKAIIFGILFSISWTPCIGTFLSSALLLIAKQESILKGIILMGLYLIGLGIPFIISALLLDKMKNIFQFIKNNYNKIKILSGLILVVMGFYTIFF